MHSFHAFPCPRCRMDLSFPCYDLQSTSVVMQHTIIWIRANKFKQRHCAVLKASSSFRKFIHTVGSQFDKQFPSQYYAMHFMQTDQETTATLTCLDEILTDNSNVCSVCFSKLMKGQWPKASSPDQTLVICIAVRSVLVQQAHVPIAVFCPCKYEGKSR